MQPIKKTYYFGDLSYVLNDKLFDGLYDKMCEHESCYHNIPITITDNMSMVCYICPTKHHCYTYQITGLKSHKHITILSAPYNSKICLHSETIGLICLDELVNLANLINLVNVVNVANFGLDYSLPELIKRIEQYHGGLIFRVKTTKIEPIVSLFNAGIQNQQTTNTYRCPSCHGLGYHIDCLELDNPDNCNSICHNCNGSGEIEDKCWRSHQLRLGDIVLCEIIS